MMDDNKNMWNDTLAAIEHLVSSATFSTWFKGTHIVKIEEGSVFVGVPSQFYKEMLAEKYHKIILRALRDTIEGVRTIEYVIAKEDASALNHTPKHTISIPPTQEIPLSDHYINRADNLNPRYTFENFVVGAFNELAHAAAQAVIANPGITYNPLFIYGRTGYGKTHIIQAIGNQLKQHRNSKVYYTTAERFGTEIVNAFQQNTIQKVKQRYHNHSVLIFDDIQFLSRKEKLQEELFHIFNTFYEDNKQIIFSSDRHPNHITDIADRLQTRFMQGMTIDVSEPDHEARVAILRKKAAQNGYVLDTEVANLLADVVRGSIRDLEGTLNRVLCEAQIKGRELQFAEVYNIVKENTKTDRRVSTKEIVSRVAKYYNIHEAAVYEKTRKKEVVRPRQIIMYILREDFNISYPTIGTELGGRDHTTVMHSCERIKEELEQSGELQKEIDEIRVLLR
jgi:chromosomal replication initiator protein